MQKRNITSVRLRRVGRRKIHTTNTLPPISLISWISWALPEQPNILSSSFSTVTSAMCPTNSSSGVTIIIFTSSSSSPTQLTSCKWLMYTCSDLGRAVGTKNTFDADTRMKENNYFEFLKRSSQLDL